MSLRDEALQKVFSAIERHTDEHYRLQCPISEVAGEILSIPELAKGLEAYEQGKADGRI